ncbi:MAG: DUF992 domain-containing protein [Mariprofundaceae bacterium]
MPGPTALEVNAMQAAMQKTVTRLSLLLPILSAMSGAGCIPHADPISAPPPRVGMLSCKIVPDSGINLLIHSTRAVTCTFKPESGDAVEHYKGETGIGFGLDVNINQRSRVAYVVAAGHFRPGTHQLAGRYSGAGGGASLGVQAGGSAPLQKRDRSIILQPTQVLNSGAGAALGLTYLYLEPAHP